MDGNFKEVKQRNLKIDGNVFEPDQLENERFQAEATQLLSQKNAFFLRDELRDASYIVKNGKKGKKKDHTKPMKAVIEKLDAVQKALSWKVAEDEKMINAQLGSITSALKEVLYACDDYIDSHKNPHSSEGQVRKSHVMRIRELVKNDAAMLSARTRQYIKDEVGKERPEENLLNLEDHSITWLTLFGSARCERIEEGNGITIENGGNLGAGMLIVKQEGKKNRYLKADERKKEHSAGAAIGLVSDRLNKKIEGLKSEEQTEAKKAEIEKLTRQSGYLDSFKRALVANRGSSALTRSKVGFVQSVFLQNLRKGTKNETALKNIITVLGLNGTAFASQVNMVINLKNNAANLRNDLNKQMLALDLDMQKKGKNHPKYQEMDAEYLELEKERNEQIDSVKQANAQIAEMFEVMDQLGKQMNSDDMASAVAYITPGTSLAKRNVATYRLAQFLGLGDMVAKAELKEVKMNGSVGTYMEMEAAEGEEPDRIAKQNGVKTFRYSLKAVEQLAALQIFDIICGQVDRHRANYLATTEEKDGVVIMTGIKAIDNDLSLGLLTYDEIKGAQKHQQIRSIEDKDGDVRIPAISDVLANRIMEMTPGMVDYLVIDLLSRAEISALKTRIKGVQNMIKRRRKLEQSGKVKKSWFAKSEKDWKRAREYIEEQAENEVDAEEDYRFDFKTDPTVQHEGVLYNSSYYHASWLNVKRKDGKFYHGK